uniref:ATP synthase F0 subunit 8 n=1 Tax=Panagrolaimus sp. JU765 TaxID=591449 RepID=A0AC34RDA2_9BILA
MTANYILLALLVLIFLVLFASARIKDYLNDATFRNKSLTERYQEMSPPCRLFILVFPVSVHFCLHNPPNWKTLPFTVSDEKWRQRKGTGRR